MLQAVPYCGSAPIPDDLLARFNWDPILIVSLCLICIGHVSALKKRTSVTQQQIVCALMGWLVAAVALISPLCALSVSLFCARVGQHMILILVAGPLIAIGWPRAHRSSRSSLLWMGAVAFFVALWFWHMPVPYEATFRSAWVYWSMHITLFGASILLWRELLDHSVGQTAQVLTAGILTFMHMGLLGAILTFADRPMFPWHFLTTEAWGLTPLQDQQLGGTVMWVPGIALFLWTTLRSIARLRGSMERARPA